MSVNIDQQLIDNVNIENANADIAQIFERLAQSRRSIRGFLPQPVEQSVLQRIFNTAASAPSNCNTQPWCAHVVSGAMRDRLSKIFVEETIGQSKFSMDFPYDGKYQDVYRKRQIDVAIMLYQALGVEREDKKGRHRAFLRNLEFFDAPHVVFLFMPDWGDVREAADVGMYAQNLMLAMQAHGLASCPQTTLGYDAETVRRELNIDPSMKLLFGISFGYEDTSLPENQILPDRASLDESVSFHE